MALRSVRFGVRLRKLSKCFGSASEGTLHLLLVPAAFAVVSTHQPALGPRGFGPFSLCVIHKEGLCPSSGDINRLMMMKTE
jgi:hypothetical protein